MYPSSFLRQFQSSNAPPHSLLGKGKGKGKMRVSVYDRDIVCLPNWYRGDGPDGIIEIPRRKEIREYLGANKLIRKIQLVSNMSQQAIYDEIRSVFEIPMGNNDDFRFVILQPSGGDSQCLMIPEVSRTYQWSAGAVAKSSRTPIYILALDDLSVPVYKNMHASTMLFSSYTFSHLLMRI
jgi:hypothetical protein